MNLFSLIYENSAEASSCQKVSTHAYRDNIHKEKYLEEPPPDVSPEKADPAFTGQAGSENGDAAPAPPAIVCHPEHENCHPKYEKYLNLSRAWLEKHMPELRDAGWTIEEIYQTGGARWPYGSWGVAYLPTWKYKNVTISIHSHSGAIVFTFSGTNGRKITQSAHPLKSTRKIRKIDIEELLE